MKRTVLTLIAMFSLVPLAHAQFGSGIVYDPTQSAHAITQIENEGRSLENQAQQIENGQQIFTNTVKIAATAIQTYNTVHQQYNLYHEMMLAPQLLYSRFLSPMTDLQMLEQTANTYGNSASWVNSANTGKGAPASYEQVSVPHTNNVIPGYANTSITAQQQIAAQGATVDLGDSVMSNNLAVLGTIRANQTSRQTDIANLEAASQSQDPSQQTEMAELQRINQILLLQLRTMQDANQINANLALQQIVAQKQQQDTLKAGFQDSASFTNTYQAHVAPAYNGGAQALTY
ncbi:MAG TPA: hypothetical protein VHX20_15870 [Terracidiphilus sp.]|jgi:hypothetical protein|nr:hypothetical protein [Terracidiphilus sp.]